MTKPAIHLGLVDALSAISSSLSGAFLDSRKHFRNPAPDAHDAYCNWLRQEIKNVLSAPRLSHLLQQFGLDWLTLHYRTRHPREQWSRDREWIQLGLPLELWLVPYSSDLLAYREGVSPYIAAFSEQKENPGVPILIELGSEDQVVPAEARGWSSALTVRTPLFHFFVGITKGPDPQGALSESEYAEALRLDAEGVSKIIQFIRQWTVTESTSILEERACLGVFRNACRVTFLGFQKEIGLTLPRTVVLATVYVEHNVIGGVSFIGQKESGLGLDEGLILQHLASALLGNLRLREEDHREASIFQVEELERARAEFIQRLAHRVQSPLDSLLLRVGDGISALKIIEEAVQSLREATDEIIVAFAKRDVDDFLRLKLGRFNISDLMDTILFMQSRSFLEKKIQLNLANPVPTDWVIVVDKAGIIEVMGNLLANALRYARSRVDVAVEQDKSKGVFIFRVMDDGGDIDPAIIKKLFQPGVRDSRTDVSEVKTHGFGLYLSRKLIEKHGGEIFLSKSDVGHTEFTVIMPENGPRTA